MIRYINVKSRTRNEFIDISDKIQEAIKEEGITSGICYIYVPHTTAGVTINEGADTSVQRDVQSAFSKLIPVEADYYHREGNADAHIKSTLVGVSEFVFIDEGKLLLGTWQAVYFCEFDGPRHRRVAIKLLKTA
ncbi:MAG TPA: secondary thiamine-phosphate synthase enzyme YjbQ [Thermodesulfovibrionales bacterium]|nr:secondary thiamine-phosphate synthase enzyme YjbQ [Thermodesulfovibrionales bacterium]